MKKLHSILNNYFSEEVNSYNLGIFRFILGIGIIWTFLDKYDYILYLTENASYFSAHDFFEWVRPLRPQYMKILLNTGIVFAIFFALGLFRYFSLVITFIIFSYFFVFDIGHYNNHYYLYLLLLCLFLFLGIPKSFTFPTINKNRTDSIKLWKLNLFKIQFTIMYFYAGLVKINIDWLKGFPLKIWLYQASLNYVGFLQNVLQSEYFAISLSYIGIIFDLTIGIALWFKKTRKPALIFLVLFHAINFLLWDIGSFPFVAFFSTVLFFSPLIKHHRIKKINYNKKQILISKLFFTCWILIQLLLPIRSIFYKGHVFFNGEGLMYSWRMKLYQIEAANNIKIKIKETNEVFDVNIDKYVTLNQLMHMNINPATFLKFTNFLKNKIKIENPNVTPIIHMEIWRSVNGRDLVLINDTSLNYSNVKYKPFKHQDCFIDFKLKDQEEPKLYLNNQRNWQEFIRH